MIYKTISSPLGTIVISSDKQKITGLHLEDDQYFPNIPTEWTKESDHPLLLQAEQQLSEYFEGSRKKFNLPLTYQGTVFQMKVWAALEDLAVDQTISYKELAVKIGKPNAVRAVGGAVGRNPICIIIPCHRVLASNGTLGGYVAGTNRKMQLLQLENINS